MAGRGSCFYATGFPLPRGRTGGWPRHSQSAQTALARKTKGLTGSDDVPEAPAIPTSVLGDVWQLGRHRLVCGDCTDAKTVILALHELGAHLMVTDPPYGVDYDPKWRAKAGVNRNKGTATGMHPQSRAGMKHPRPTWSPG